MSPASYLTAPPRGVAHRLATAGGWAGTVDIDAASEPLGALMPITGQVQAKTRGPQPRRARAWLPAWASGIPGKLVLKFPRRRGSGPLADSCSACLKKYPSAGTAKHPSRGGRGSATIYDRCALPIAVIDMGSNSTRLLVADVGDPFSPRHLDRRSTVTGLARGVDSSGQLSNEAIERVCEVIAGYLEIARSHGADQVLALATSAVRDASNGGAFIAELRERFALDARVIEGSTEAQLTYRGATAGRSFDGPTLVFDIGGGSTELIVDAGPRGSGETGAKSEIAFHDSLQLGVVRHSERFLRGDPPSATELEALANSVGGELAAARHRYGGPTPARAITVAGTPTSMAAIELALDPYDPAAVEGHELRLEFLQKQLGRLACISTAERRQVRGLDPDRAPTIVAGVVILIATMRAFGIDSVEVSHNDILLGAALGAKAPSAR